ncbi:MAG: formamidopyrimidine-DNA glycosylase [Myxococcales bacterium]|nr:formamidopyrimidine-DNA glycosylase [Myxococcales bacterium]
MPELPDVTVYVERLRAHVLGRALARVRLQSPFLLRSVDPPLSATFGRDVVDVRRLGKRICFGLAGDLWLVLHLMIAGRLRWKPPDAKPHARNGLAAFDFEHGTLVLTEASKKKRASLYVVEGEAGLAEHDRGGYEVLEGDAAGFRAALLRENRTLKRALTDPRILSGIGNAYSDEILWAARLSPVKLTSRLTDDELARLHAATVDTLTTWTERLRADVGEGFPDKVTAFHDDMAVHGRYREPCPACGKPVQRIRYAENETNYCARCQNADRLLADRSLSQLMKKDWPRTLDELESKRGG